MIRLVVLATALAACSHPAPAHPVAAPPPPPPQPLMDHPVADPVTAAVSDKPMIKRHVHEHLAQLQYCYEKELLAKPGLGGVVHASFTVGSDGKVATSTATGIAEVNDCVAAVIKAIAFEPPITGHAAVEYPFVFHTTEPDTVAPAPAPVVANGGDPDRVMIRRHIRREIAKIQYCYEKQLLATPGLAGTTTVAFAIEADGTVGASAGSGLQPAVDSCVAAVIRDIHFDPPSTGRTEVTYPFVFHEADETKAPSPTVSVGTTAGAPDHKVMIRDHIRRELSRITYCYEKQLLAKGDGLAGTVTVSFFITPDGTVASAKGSGMDADVATCVADVIKTIAFDKPAGGGGIEVNYPFVFHRAN